MPEGDTIRRLADHLHPRVVGRTVDRSVLRHNRWATVDLAGLAILQVEAAGKHLLMRLGRDGEHRLTIHSHLRMNGKWSLGVPRSTPPWRRRIEMWLDQGPPLVGIDLPVLELGRPAAEPGWVGHLGPDLCAPEFDRDRAIANLAANPDLPLSAALLDQRNLAGIGNLYANEIGFLCALSPWTRVGDVRGLALPVDLARALLPVNAAAGPQTTTGFVGRGREHHIYRHRGRPCPVCETTLEAADEADVPWGRVTTWCPTCQGAVADAARARHLLRHHRQAMRAWATLTA